MCVRFVCVMVCVCALCVHVCVYWDECVFTVCVHIYKDMHTYTFLRLFVQCYLQFFLNIPITCNMHYPKRNLNNRTTMTKVFNFVKVLFFDNRIHISR